MAGLEEAQITRKSRKGNADRRGSPRSIRSGKSAARRKQVEDTTERAAHCADSPTPRCTRWMKKCHCLNENQLREMKQAAMLVDLIGACYLQLASPYTAPVSGGSLGACPVQQDPVS